MFVRLPFKINVNIVIILMSKETKFSTSLFRLFFYFKSYEEADTMALRQPGKEILLLKSSSHQRKVPLTLFCHISLFWISTLPSRFTLPHLLREVIWGPALSFSVCPEKVADPTKTKGGSSNDVPSSCPFSIFTLHCIITCIILAKVI